MPESGGRRLAGYDLEQENRLRTPQNGSVASTSSPMGTTSLPVRLTLSTNGFDQNMIGRMDNAGSIAWTNIAGGDSTYDGFDGCIHPKRHPVCGATTATFGQGARDFQLITFDGAGTFLIGKTYGWSGRGSGAKLYSR